MDKKTDPLAKTIENADDPKKFFLSSTSEDFEAVIVIEKGFTKDHMGEMLFVTINTNEEDHKRIMESQLLSMRIIKFEEGMSKFRPDSTEFSAFIKQYLEGSLKPHLMSEEIPEDWYLILVGKNFEQVSRALAGVRFVIAQMDSTSNEVEDAKIKGFIKLFQKVNSKIIDYNGERTLDGLVKFQEYDGVNGAAADGDMDEDGLGHDEL